MITSNSESMMWENSISLLSIEYLESNVIILEKEYKIIRFQKLD